MPRVPRLPLRPLALLVLLALLACGTSGGDGATSQRPAANPGDSPTAAAPVADAGLRAAYIRELQRRAGPEHALRSAAAGRHVEGDNRGHGLRFALSSEELSVTLGAWAAEATASVYVALRWSRWGREGALQPVAPATSLSLDRQRVESTRGEGLTEWYLNGPLGLEQGFVLDARPAGAGPVVIELDTSGDLTPRPAAGGGIELRAPTGLERLRYTDLFAQDATGRSLPARMAVEGTTIRLLIDDEGGSYPLYVDPLLWTEEQKLVPLGVAHSDTVFGDSVAADGATVVIGASGSLSSPGAAYVFVDSAGTWLLEQELLAPDGANGDWFGEDVAIEGNTVVVGAPAHQGTGAAYVFTRSGGVWSLEQKLVAGDGATSDSFGGAVTLSADTALVGASLAEAPATNTGAAYVFTRSGGVWSLEQKLAASDGLAQDQFGNALSLQGDTAFVAASNADPITTGSGATYVFTRSGGVWTEQQKLTPSDGVFNGFFGSAIALQGDTALIGASGAEACYAFVLSAGVWAEQQKLVASDGASFDGFGASVSMDADAAVIGAPSDDDGGISSGSAYYFLRSGGIWAEQQKLLASDGGAGDGFGGAVAVEGGALFSGARLHDGKGSNAGTTYRFELDAGSWIEVQSLFTGMAAGSDHIGSSVSIDGDTVVLGAYLDDDRGFNAGAAYVFVRVGGIWSLQEKLHASDAQDVDTFGWSVAVSGDTALVAADGADEAGVDAGAVYVFLRSGAVWTEQQKLVAGDGAAGDHFGRSLSLEGDTAVVGAPQHGGVGAAYVFSRSGGVWSQQQKLTASGAVSGDDFGDSVSLSGDTLLAGAPYDDTAMQDGGAAYAFVRAGGVWSEQQVLVPSDPSTLARFGAAVGLSGDTALIGAWADDEAASNAGAAYAFARSANSWAQQQKLMASDATSNDRFGWAVALAGNRALIGAPYATPGAGYVFVGGGGVWTEHDRLAASDGASEFGGAVALSGDSAVLGAPNDAYGGANGVGSGYVFVVSTFADGTPCQADDECQSGFCVDGVCCDSSCGGGDLDDCVACTTGVCTALPDALSCDDADACTQLDSCQAGVCTGSDPVICTALDACHAAGTCDPASGQCDDPPLPDDTPCNDADGCTQLDSCQAGVCTGSDPVVCTPLDSCHDAGTCDPATGLCDDPTLPDGALCDDGECQNGVCELVGTGGGGGSGGGSGGAGGSGGTGGMGGTGGEVATGGSGQGGEGQGGGTAMGGGGQGGGSPPGGKDASPAESGGCGCQLPGRHPALPERPAILLVGLVLLRLRRRR